MIRTDGPWFKDEANRRLLLRGINLSGSTKVPFTPNGATHLRENFFDHRTVSFVGRPFPLAEADEHLSRLRRWGFNFLRFLVTWEAIEHAGPGSYDEAYLDYVVQVIRKAAQHGFDVFIDPHQDVWSRFTGGDGAPGWTLEAGGFDLTRLHETGTAFVHAMTAGEYPRMIWPTNYHKLAAATMFTLFFAGNDFAPNTLVDGVPVQEFLQGHYIHAMQQLAIRLKDEPNVIGYDSLNEPHRGFAGLHNLNSIHPPFDFGPSPTPLQSFALGDGIPQTVGVYEQGITGRRQVERRKLNPAGVRLAARPRMHLARPRGVGCGRERPALPAETRLLYPCGRAQGGFSPRLSAPLCQPLRPRHPYGASQCDPLPGRHPGRRAARVGAERRRKYRQRHPLVRRHHPLPQGLPQLVQRGY